MVYLCSCSASGSPFPMPPMASYYPGSSGGWVTATNAGNNIYAAPVRRGGVLLCSVMTITLAAGFMNEEAHRRAPFPIRGAPPRIQRNEWYMPPEHNHQETHEGPPRYQIVEASAINTASAASSGYRILSGV
jgi:hypothetical protein